MPTRLSPNSTPLVTRAPPDTRSGTVPQCVAPSPDIDPLSLHDALPISELTPPTSAFQPTHLSFFGPACIPRDRKSTRLNSSHVAISYAVFCSKKKIQMSSLRMSMMSAEIGSAYV